jgi:EcsC protein family
MTLPELPRPEDEDEDSGRLEDLLAGAIERVRALVEADVERMRRRKPRLSQHELARAVVRRGTRRVGAASAATGFGGAPTLALNITSVLTLQASLVLAVAAAYDELDSPDLRQDLILILAGNSAVTAMRTVGVAAANDMGKRWVQNNVSRETMKQVNKIVSRKIVTKAGEKSLTSFMKLVPVVGAAVGYTVDRTYARTLGESAIRYYSGS